MRHYTATVASEADRLEAAIIASGLDPENLTIWNTFVHKGLRAALAALQQEGTGMTTLEDDAKQARANIAAHEEAERQRIAAIVDKASASTRVFAAEQDKAQQEATQAQERAIAQRAAARAEAERADAQRQYLLAGGEPEGFDAWYTVEKARRVSETLERQQAAARHVYAKTF